MTTPQTTEPPGSTPGGRRLLAYRITNTVNGKVYIGITSQGLQPRWLQHRHLARRGHHACPALYAAMRKYGVDAFRCEVIAESITGMIADILDTERTIIAQHGSHSHGGYNVTSGGDGVHDLPAEIRARIALAKSKPTVWGGTLFTSRRAMAKALGIREAALSTRLRLRGHPDAYSRAEQREITRRSSGTRIQVDGVEYDTIGDAAAAHSVSANTMLGWIRRGRAVRLGSRRRSVTGTTKPIEFDGRRYESRTALAMALGVDLSTVFHWLQRHRRSGGGQAIGPGRGARRRVEIGGVEFNTITEAARAHRVSTTTVSGWIMRGKARVIGADAERPRHRAGHSVEYDGVVYSSMRALADAVGRSPTTIRTKWIPSGKARLVDPLDR